MREGEIERKTPDVIGYTRQIRQKEDSFREKCYKEELYQNQRSGRKETREDEDCVISFVVTSKPLIKEKFYVLFTVVGPFLSFYITVRSTSTSANQTT